MLSQTHAPTRMRDSPPQIRKSETALFPSSLQSFGFVRTEHRGYRFLSSADRCDDGARHRNGEAFALLGFLSSQFCASDG